MVTKNGAKSKKVLKVGTKYWLTVFYSHVKLFYVIGE